MTRTFRRRLMLAWLLAKLVSQLEKLHLARKPKQRHVVRNVVLAGSTLAVAVVVAGVVHSRRGRSRGAAALNGWAAPEQPTPAAESDQAGPPTDTERVDGAAEA